jgi:hypothetical protein
MAETGRDGLAVLLFCWASIGFVDLLRQCKPMTALLIRLGLKPKAISENPLKRVQDLIEISRNCSDSILDPTTRFNGFEPIALGFNPRRMRGVV